tara:strand:- start:3891 stop:5099 length:1209 start_codon:yes stop_codon:yes gene_type:complete
MNKLKGIELINYGSTLSEINPWLAQKIMSEGIKHEAEISGAYYNLGIALHLQKRPIEASKAYKISLKIPGGPEKSARANLAQDLLLNDNFREGWKAYESRFRSNQHSYFRYHFGNAWNGKITNVNEKKRLILVSEQGFGDTIQFCRFASFLEHLGFDIVLFCQEQLIPLLSKGSGIKHITSALYEEHSKIDSFWCPLLSIPMKLNINNNNNIPFQKPYIKAPKDNILYWKKNLIREKNFKLIGIHWQGNPEFEKRLYSKGRSMKFKDLLDLNFPENVEFVSLQKGTAQEQLKINNHIPLVKGQKHLDKSLSFLDTAGVIALCDLVITTDNVIAHLSGAMGIKTWVALQWVPEWRWGLEGQNSIWYPSIKLFRQKSSGDWSSVINEINESLSRLFRETTNSKN